MGYHVELVASPPRRIGWDALSHAAIALGWTPLDGPPRLRLDTGGQPVATLQITDGTPWSASSDAAGLTALIQLADSLGLRVRGEEGESYRSPDDWYVHPDDAALRAAPKGPSGQEMRRQAQARVNRKTAMVMLTLLALSGIAYLWRHRT